jgi:hypothetical protein
MRRTEATRRLPQHAGIRSRRDVTDFNAAQFAALRERGELGFTGSGQRHRPFGPVKEPHAEQPFGLLDLPRQRRRGDFEFISRPRKMQVLRDAGDTAEVAKFELPHGIVNSVNYIVIL